ncbi:MAG: hypothetical protein WBF04_06995 [Candidatus Sulfotelmatobacter sp.]
MRVSLQDNLEMKPETKYQHPLIVCRRCGQPIKHEEWFRLDAGIYGNAVMRVQGKHYPHCPRLVKPLPGY